VPVLVVEIVPVLVVEMVPLFENAGTDKSAITIAEHTLYLKVFMIFSPNTYIRHCGSTRLFLFQPLADL